jgi:hypothetical protein
MMRSKTMHPSFGIETRPTSMRWEDIIKGPPLEAVRAHLFKVVNYTTLMSEKVSTPRMLNQDKPAPVVSERSVDAGHAAEDQRLAA